jgi:hypothetical protein
MSHIQYALISVAFASSDGSGSVRGATRTVLFIVAVAFTFAVAAIAAIAAKRLFIFEFASIYSKV